MPVSLEEYDLPSMVGWLIGLHGHDTVRGILGDRFDGLRTGRLNLDEVDMQAREALSQLIEGAILAGMQPPPQPRRTVVPPDAPGPTHHVVAQDLAKSARGFAGNHTTRPRSGRRARTPRPLVGVWVERTGRSV